MAAKRKLTARAQWAIAILVIGTGVLATLLVANAVNHAGWDPWLVAVGWVAVVGVFTVSIKLRANSGLTGPMGGDARGTS
jgi:hypothetical protein